MSLIKRLFTRRKAQSTTPRPLTLFEQLERSRIYGFYAVDWQGW